MGVRRCDRCRDRIEDRQGVPDELAENGEGAVHADVPGEARRMGSKGKGGEKVRSGELRDRRLKHRPASGKRADNGRPMSAMAKNGADGAPGGDVPGNRSAKEKGGEKV